MRKRMNNRGETIVEALLSVVVISLGMLILSGALIVTSGNAAKSHEIVSGSLDKTPAANLYVTIDDENENTPTIESQSVSVYRTGSENAPTYYYRYMYVETFPMLDDGDDD